MRRDALIHGARLLSRFMFATEAARLVAVMTRSIRILGVDPGLRRTGWAVLEVSGSRLRALGAGVVAPTPSHPLATRLAALASGLQVAFDWSPKQAAIETAFVRTDPKAALMLGHARGVAMAALATAGLPVVEFAPTLIKKAVTGSGRADKSQVAFMAARLAPGVALEQNDATDALAVAICAALRAPDQAAA